MNRKIFKRKHPMSWGCLALLGISWILAVILGVQLLSSPDKCLENLNENTVHIDKVSLLDSHNLRGYRMKLKIVDRDRTYYLWYPQSAYRLYSEAILEDLLSGNVDTIVIKSVNPSLRDRLRNKRRIVDLRTEDAVYYDLQSEIQSSKIRLVEGWIGFVIMTAAAISGTVFVIWFYVLPSHRRKS